MVVRFDDEDGDEDYDSDDDCDSCGDRFGNEVEGGNKVPVSSHRGSFTDLAVAPHRSRLVVESTKRGLTRYVS